MTCVLDEQHVPHLSLPSRSIKGKTNDAKKTTSSTTSCDKFFCRVRAPENPVDVSFSHFLELTREICKGRLGWPRPIYFLCAVKIVASFCTFSVGLYRHVKICTALVFTGEQRKIIRDTSETETVISAIRLPISRRFSHCHFRKFTVNLLNFHNEHNKLKNACAELKLDENKDKVSEKSHKIISLVSYLLAETFLPLQTRDQTHLNGARVN